MITAEQAFFYGPLAMYGLAAVLFLSLMVFKKNTVKFQGPVLAIALIASAAAGAFLFMMQKYDREFAAGVDVFRPGFFCAALAPAVMALSLSGEKYRDNFFTGIAAFFFCFAVSAGFSSAFTQALCLAAADLMLLAVSAAGPGKPAFGTGEFTSRKFLYFSVAAAMLALYTVSPPLSKAAKLGINGFIFFLVVSSGYTVTMLLPAAAGSGEIRRGANTPVMLFGVMQFLVVCSVMDLNRELLMPGFLTAGFLALLALSMFRSITEELYAAFSIDDFMNIFYLACLGASAARLSTGHVTVIMAGMLLLAAFAGETGGKDSSRLTVSAVKYNFGKIKNNYVVLAAAVTGLSVEIAIFWAMYSYISPRPVVKALAILCAAVYSPALLNKAFGIFSMIKRIKVDRERKLGFNESAVRLAVFAALLTALTVRW